MTHDTRRITLILRASSGAQREWNATADSLSRLIFAESFSVLQHALRTAVTEFDRDVERVILDRSITAAQFLDLLAALPNEFGGDVLMIRYDDSAFLSAGGRGGDRVLYSLNATDVRFYLETLRLTRDRFATVAA